MNELSPEMIETMRHRIAALGERECDSAVISAAQRIVEPKFKGSSSNVYSVLPQLADDVRKGADALINVNRNGTIEDYELTAAVIAAARLAKIKGINLEDVPVEQIIELSPAICAQLVEDKNVQCRAPAARGK